MRSIVAALLLASSAAAAPVELSSEQVYKVLTAHAAAFHACFVRHDDAIVTMRFTIEASGVVRASAPVDRADPEIASCLTGELRKLRFPTSQRSTEITYPFGHDRPKGVSGSFVAASARGACGRREEARRSVPPVQRS